MHEVESADGRKFLVSMPTKFRKSLWVKRGNEEYICFYAFDAREHHWSLPIIFDLREIQRSCSAEELKELASL